MNSVLNLEIPVNDVRLARCQHPRLRQALMFQPTTAPTWDSVKKSGSSQKPTSSFKLAEPTAQRGALSNLKGAVAVAFVRVMSSLFDGQIVTV
ncbi:MAG: hypothetical protein KC800_28780 [Candidatus Eremiobacteraeota bacterium]|nr:hypothetical protein [Candidatus Eremiobacteraeota bacterium]